MSLANSLAKSSERRHSQRRLIKPHGENPARHRRAAARLHVEGFEVPDDFVLLLSGDGLAQECNYQVVWRLGHEIGARFMGVVRRGGAARA